MYNFYAINRVFNDDKNKKIKKKCFDFNTFGNAKPYTYCH